MLAITPPDDAWFRIFTQFGSSGILLAGLAWLVRYYMSDSEARRQETAKQAEDWRKETAVHYELLNRQMLTRVELAEKRLDACEGDRESLHRQVAELHKQFGDMLLKFTHPPS